MKLFTQYNRITLWVLVLFFLLSSIVHYFLMRGLLFRELDLSLSKIEKRMEAYIRVHDAFPVVQSLDDLHIVYARTDRDGGSRTFRLIPPAEGKNSDNIRELSFFVKLDHQWYKVSVSKNLEGIHGTARMVTMSAIVTILVVIIASLLVNRLVFRKLWQPFYSTIAAIGQFQLGKHSTVRLPDTKIEEFNFMNHHLQRMAARIDREYLILKEFTENASHEMQTPLAIIRSKLDLAIQDQHLSEMQSSTLQSAYASVKKLTSLNRSLLLIAKISNDQYSSSTMINVKEKLYDKIIQFQELWKDKLTVTYDLNDAEINANPDLVDILLNNLFSNASKHNIQDGRVMLHLTATTLEIKNTGRPVSLDRTRMFQRFYKGSLEDDNNGLGLSIIKQICDLSGIVLSYSFSGNIHVFTLQWNGPAGTVDVS
ncbi:MAG TPA: HAMP domain-containing sensor histidine kinase [Puia sp.]|jgi:signal transduction histidine kinase